MDDGHAHAVAVGHGEQGVHWRAMAVVGQGTRGREVGQEQEVDLGGHGTISLGGQGVGAGHVQRGKGGQGLTGWQLVVGMGKGVDWTRWEQLHGGGGGGQVSRVVTAMRVEGEVSRDVSTEDDTKGVVGGMLLRVGHVQGVGRGQVAVLVVVEVVVVEVEVVVAVVGGVVGTFMEIVFGGRVGTTIDVGLAVVVVVVVNSS